jgi:hypothetical protein
VALQEVQQPTPKRARLSDTQLMAMEKTELIEKIHALEDELDQARKSAIASSSETSAMSKEEADTQANKARKLMIKGIESQMKVSTVSPFASSYIESSF